MFGLKTTRPVPHVVIDASQRGIRITLTQLYEYRDLFWHLASRDLLVRYKQSILGFFWVILQPLALMLVLTLFFGLMGRSSPKDVSGTPIPYPLYYFSALLIWQYFDNSLSRAMNSLSSGMITKIYFPRIILPAASVLPGLLDLLFSLVVYAGLFLYFDFVKGTHLSLSLVHLLWVPVFVLFAMLTAFGTGAWFAALKIKYRDMNHLVPVITRIWFFASPVIYDASRIPEQYRMLFGLNPMVGVIEGFRWVLVNGAPPHPDLVLGSAMSSVLLAVSGVYYFLRTEKHFADDI